MPTTQRILCPVDLTESSHAALAHAVRLAATLGAKLDVLHAYYVPAYIQPSLVVWMNTGPRPALEVAADRARADLHEFLSRHGDLGPNVELYLSNEEPASAIVTRAKALDSALIVMGTHGRTGAGRLVTGSVAERVVRYAPCPVLTVRDPVQASSARSARASEARHPL